MITHHKVDGYENFKKLMTVLDAKGPLVLYFSGSPNPEGQSWCSDCRNADPIVQEVLQDNEKKTFHFVHVGVGTRDQWTDCKCKFKRDPKLKLRRLPTLLIWRTPERLIWKQCLNQDHLNLLLTDIH